MLSSDYPRCQSVYYHFRVWSKKNEQVEVVKRSKLHKFVVRPCHWVGECLFGWLDKFRRLWKNCERKLIISAQILTFALIAILIRRF